MLVTLPFTLFTLITFTFDNGSKVFPLMMIPFTLEGKVCCAKVSEVVIKNKKATKYLMSLFEGLKV